MLPMHQRIADLRDSLLLVIDEVTTTCIVLQRKLSTKYVDYAMQNASYVALNVPSELAQTFLDLVSDMCCQWHIMTQDERIELYEKIYSTGEKLKAALKSGQIQVIY